MATAVNPTIRGSGTQKLLDALQNDMRNLSIETRKKYSHVKESAEEALVKLRNAASDLETPFQYLTNQILYPLVQGCETRDSKIVRLCIVTIQRLITHKVVDYKGARYVTDTLWMLMESAVEEVKVLQTVTLLLTTNTVVQGDILAKNLSLCFRLHFTKDSTTINTAGATVRQLVSLVFERVIAEDSVARSLSEVQKEVNLEELKIPSGIPPRRLKPCAADAYLMFQDLVQLVNADQPYWLTGLTEMTRTFGLELLESVLLTYPSVFFRHPEFSFLLKERVCALVIKLFSPNIKYRNSVPASVQQATPLDKPYFPISVRLLRVVSVLIQKYYSILVTECEIFLSLIVKFLDPDKPVWQRSLALEVLHRMVIQSDLLKSFCQCYDMKPHATNIFQDIVNSLGAYVQSVFVNPQLMNQGGSSSVTSQSLTQGQSPSLLAGMPVGPGVSPQPGFFYRGVWLPIIFLNGGQSRATHLEMLDKLEPPLIPEGYGISMAYGCLLDIVRSVSLIIEGVTSGVESSDIKIPYTADEEERALHAQLINSSWCGLLAALSLLLDASTDESATENILKSVQTYASLCGRLQLNTPRDAFITALCRASLPPHYTLTVLNITPQATGTSRTQFRHTGQDMNAQYNTVGHYNEADYRQQVVAVGTPLPTASLPLGAQQGPVMLTAKNLQCMRAILSIAHCHGGILGSAWHLVLTTLQHLVWILGLKPSTGGSLKAGRTTNETNAVITTAVMADLPVLSAMLSRLFESSQYLNDVALHHLIDALCKLSHEAMDLAYSNREPSLFAVAKLLETGLINLPRVEVLWRPLTNHLLEVCQHPHIRMREWGVEAVTYLVKTALQHKYDPPLKENQKLQTLLLSPLMELSSIPHPDIRQKQLECVLQILHSAGETLSHGWPLVLNIIGAVTDTQSENLVRVAFQCLQLVVTDFLPVMPWHCLPLCVDTAAKFGSQTQELNISLTAIGLMWNISDYFYQNQEKLRESLSGDCKIFPEFPGTPNMPAFDKLWMCLYARLGDLCVDPRPAVRKSAGQTLFSTIAAHGGLLHQPTWQAVLWQVLFPLLDKVRSLSGSASSEKVDSGGNILIHHSRNTAQKQWAETQVLTLSGVARVFNTKRRLLQTLGDFPRAWALLLEFIESSALSKNDEVSLAALKAFQEILYTNLGKSCGSTGDGTSESECTGDNQAESACTWNAAWKVWYSIGMESTRPPAQMGRKEDLYIPSQPFLTALVQIFPGVFQHIRKRFVGADLQKLCTVLQNAIAVPVTGEASPFVLPSPAEMVLTPLQEGVLQCMEGLQQEALTGTDNVRAMIPCLFNQGLLFSRYACQAPTYGKLQGKSVVQAKAVHTDWVAMNYVPFGEKALAMVISLYQKTANLKAVIQAYVLQNIIKTIRLPLGMKYDCPSQTTWKLGVTALLAVLHEGLPLAHKHMDEYRRMWPELATAFDEFLFSKSLPPSTQSPEEFQADEAVDCQVIELIREEILPYSHSVPKEFILKVMVLLNKGSIHSATSSAISEIGHKLREEFAKTCFETLLQFSLLNQMDGLEAFTLPQNSEKEENSLTSRLAVTSLLHRFNEVLKKYVDDEKLSGKCPLPRHRLSEISFVLKAVATLISSLKKAPPGKVDQSTWMQLINLYPHLVDCTTTTSSQVARSLREALHQYQDLLQPPKGLQNGV